MGEDRWVLFHLLNYPICHMKRAIFLLYIMIKTFSPSLVIQWKMITAKSHDFLHFLKLQWYLLLIMIHLRLHQSKGLRARGPLRRAKVPWVTHSLHDYGHTSELHLPVIYDSDIIIYPLSHSCSAYSVAWCLLVALYIDRWILCTKALPRLISMSLSSQKWRMGQLWSIQWGYWLENWSIWKAKIKK